MTGSLDPLSGGNSIFTSEYSTYAHNSITLDEAKNTVEALLQILVDLEIEIRRAGTASRMRRADRTFDKRRQDYKELLEHLKFILRVSGAPRRNHTLENQRSTPVDIDNIVVAPASNQSKPLQQNYILTNQRSTPTKTDEIDIKSALDQLMGEKAPLRPE